MSIVVPGSGAANANNGLAIATGNYVQLGGSLIKDTAIAQGTNALTIYKTTRNTTPIYVGQLNLQTDTDSNRGLVIESNYNNSYSGSLIYAISSYGTPTAPVAKPAGSYILEIISKGYYNGGYSVNDPCTVCTFIDNPYSVLGSGFAIITNQNGNYSYPNFLSRANGSIGIGNLGMIHSSYSIPDFNDSLAIYGSGNNMLRAINSVGVTCFTVNNSGQVIIGVNSVLASPVSGALENDGTNLYYTDSTGERWILSKTAAPVGNVIGTEDGNILGTEDGGELGTN